MSATHGRMSPGNLVYHCQLNMIREFRAGFLSRDTSLTSECLRSWQLAVDRGTPSGSRLSGDEVDNQCPIGNEVAQGQERNGGVISLIMTTNHSACRAVGPSDRGRLITTATKASPAAMIVVSANHSTIGISPR